MAQRHRRLRRRSHAWLWLVPVPFLLAVLAVGGLKLREQLALDRIPALRQEELAAAIVPGETAAQSPWGESLAALERDSLRWECAGEPVYEGRSTNRSARQRVVLYTVDDGALQESLTARCQGILEEQALAAARCDAVYDAALHWREDLSRAAFTQALGELTPGEARQTLEAELHFSWDGESWRLRQDQELDRLRAALSAQDPDSRAEALYTRTCATLQPVFRSYAPLDEYAVQGPQPSPAWFTATDNPQDVADLLQSAPAQRLMNGQQPLWNPDIALFPGSVIRTYLDDTILVIVWQEVEAEAVGTFSEVFISDASQLRRKIAGDTPYSMEFETTSAFCRDARAVLAVGGDFYNHARACGVCVYQRQMIRFEPRSCDCCYFTADGDMLFSYREQFSSQGEAQRFIEDNNVLFSLAFGPVLVDNGVDVTPDWYMWGEISDTYARSAIGLLGEKHYLTMNINCDRPGSWYYNLATLRQAADAMIRRGCLKAYTLDGGQTATTAFNGELINPVQFGREKEISDVLYFATLVPG